MDTIKRIAIAIPTVDEAIYANYFKALERAGARGVAVDGKVNSSAYDALLLPGGGDVAPERYGQPRAPASRNIDPALDGLQLGALEAFVSAKKPVLGICRGHQLVNVFFGGTLIQDLSTADSHISINRKDQVHETRALEGSLIHRLYGSSPVVNSAHHQGVDRLGEGLRAVQWSDDGVIEGMEHARLPIYCVQWHPERMNAGFPCANGADRGDALFRFFVRQITPPLCPPGRQ